MAAAPPAGRWPEWVEQCAQRFFWADPSVVADPAASPAALYRRRDGRFTRVAGTDILPDVDDLVLEAALARAAGTIPRQSIEAAAERITSIVT